MQAGHRTMTHTLFQCHGYGHYDVTYFMGLKSEEKATIKIVPCVTTMRIHPSAGRRAYHYHVHSKGINGYVVSLNQSVSLLTYKRKPFLPTRFASYDTSLGREHSILTAIQSRNCANYTEGRVRSNGIRVALKHPSRVRLDRSLLFKFPRLSHCAGCNLHTR